MTGTDILHVAYKGSTGARNDIIGGHVNMMFDEVPSVAPNVLAGQVRALGVTGKALPCCRTCHGLGHGAGLRAHRVVRHHGAGRDAQADHRYAQRRDAGDGRAPDVQATWEKHGTETMSMTPEETEAFLRAEIEKWTKVVKDANIKLE